MLLAKDPSLQGFSGPSALLVTYVAPRAGADHEPANKVAAAGSQVEVFQPGETVAVLHERVRVSSNADLILSATAECDILTSLTTGGTKENSAGAFGQVRMWVTIDDKTVPVSTDDRDEAGKVVFCNRAHEKSITDEENDDDGTDEEYDMTRTRQANGFNWLALNTGFGFDSRPTATTSSTSLCGPSSPRPRRTRPSPRLASVTARSSSSRPTRRFTKQLPPQAASFKGGAGHTMPAPPLPFWVNWCTSERAFPTSERTCHR